MKQTSTPQQPPELETPELASPRALRPGAKVRRFQRDMSAARQDYRFEVGRPEEGERLDAFLSRRVRWRSRAQIQSLIKEGRVEVVESQPATKVKGALEVTPRPAYRLRAGQEIVIWLDGPGTTQEALPGRAGRKACDVPLEVRGVYEDSHLLAIDKPPGMTVYPTRRHRHGSLIELVHRRHLQLGSPGAPPSPCHRLDRETSGVLLFARDVETRAAIGEQIESRTIQKSYLAVVEGTPAEEGIIDLELGPDPASRVKLRQAAVESGQTASTRWRLRRSFANHSLVELYPETGRQHQLRAHLFAIGHPIVGDKLYLGGDDLFLRSVDDKLSESDRQRLGHHRQALHAWRLELIHPATREPLEIEAPLPPDLVELIEQLGGCSVERQPQGGGPARSTNPTTAG